MFYLTTEPTKLIAVVRSEEREDIAYKKYVKGLNETTIEKTDFTD